MVEVLSSILLGKTTQIRVRVGLGLPSCGPGEVRPLDVYDKTQRRVEFLLKAIMSI